MASGGRRVVAAGAVLAGLAAAVVGQEVEPSTGPAPAQQSAPYSPWIEPASGEPAAVLTRLAAAEGLAVSLFAAEPLLANPVCLAIDERGDVYVGETFRHHAGVTDIREHTDWLEDDLACRTVEDRVALLQKWTGADFASWGREHERIRRLRDVDGDGVADEATVWADGFNAPEAGIGAGLLARAGAVYYTCIPDLWRLRDADDDGRADERTKLSTGYGVRITFLGHDLHGLRLGPDGRLYFSIGDRGFVVKTPDGVLDHFDTGAVLRCELDGSALELVHTGLRNPQELAFDDWGDLFTGDNNGDGGDAARIVRVLEGADSGWRHPVQWLPRRGPWMDERLWEPAFDGQAAYIVPPIANLASGPSGLTSEPGGAFGTDWAGRFLMCDFTGDPGSSSVLWFALQRQGASFALGVTGSVLSGLQATDCDFGPDGALYVSDWVEGWSQTGKGRVWRVARADDDGEPGAGGARNALSEWTRILLAEGMAGREVADLRELLFHPDRRVRMEAQLELAGRGDSGLDALERAARGLAVPRGGLGAERPELPRLARLHGIWGLGL
ncbi:MAG TPA: PVC-type heme-binding CxxCH protein, partial [Planctomycetota bacterium]|nr:PVC-type heme-binding CxxCH protein [Planctomycetota bacterium]